MTDTSAPRKATFRRSLPMLLILSVAILGAFTLKDYLSFDTLRQNHEALVAYRESHLWSSIAIFFALYVLMVAFSLPGATIGTLTAGFLFGTGLGTGVTVLAATTGATLIFLAARHGFGDQLAERMDASDGRYAKIKRGIDDNQWSMLFFIRLVPVVPFFIANLLPAFMAVPLYRYLVSTGLGIIPGSLVYNSVGAGLGELFARGETPNLGIIFEPHILLPILGLAGLSLLPVVLKALSGQKAP